MSPAPDAPRSRRWLVIGGLAAAVLIAAIALIIANRGGARADGVDPPTPTTASGSAAAPAAPATTGAQPALTGSAAPRGSAVAPPTTDTPPTVDTVADNGAATHDHRDNPGDFNRPPPAQVPPEHAVFVAQKFAGDVGTAIMPIARECASKIPSDARGAKPVIQVQLTVTIKDGHMTIDGVDTAFADVTGDQPAVKDCVKSKASAISVDATGQPDVDHYSITMPMRVAS